MEITLVLKFSKLGPVFLGNIHHFCSSLSEYVAKTKNSVEAPFLPEEQKNTPKLRVLQL
jgi:hypothetical protein